jgi:hypothetical protein
LPLIIDEKFEQGEGTVFFKSAAQLIRLRVTQNICAFNREGVLEETISGVLSDQLVPKPPFRRAEQIVFPEAVDLPLLSEQ